MIWSGPGVAARRQQFVAGGDDRDQRPARRPDSVAWLAEAASDSAAASSTRPRVEQHIAFAEIEPGAADVAAGGDRLEHLDRSVADAARILLDEDRVGAVRHRRAGEDAHGLAGADRAGEAARRRRASPITRQPCAGTSATSAARTA